MDDKPWILIKVPPDCDFRVGLRISEEELFGVGRVYHNWDVGMVFQHRNTHKLYEIQPELDLGDAHD